MTLFENIEPIIKEKKDIDSLTVNYLNGIIEKINKIMFIKEIEIFTCVSLKTIENKKIGVRSIYIKCNNKAIDIITNYNYPSDKNRSETIVLINALQIARFINLKLKLETTIYNNSEYALDFLTKRRYVKNSNNDILYFFQKTNIKDFDYAKIKKIHKKNNINKLYCKEMCQIKNLNK